MDDAKIVQMLLRVARAAYLAADDSEEVLNEDGIEHRINTTDFEGLAEALEALEELPDDKPGYTLNGPGRAEWALRGFLSTQHPKIDPWQPMSTAPKDGTAVLVLQEGSDIPNPVRWVDGWWQSSWDSYRLNCWDGPRAWMAIPAEFNNVLSAAAGLRGCNSQHGGRRSPEPCIYRMRTTDPGCTGCVERDEDQRAEAGD